MAAPWYVTLPVDEISLDLAPKVIEILRSELSEKNVTGLKDQVMDAQAAVEDMRISRDAYAELRDQAMANMRNQGACLQATMEENRQLKDLLAQARSALADFMNTLECRQIEEREIRDQFGPMAARVGILTPEAHSMGYLAKELIPPILDQLTEALEYGRKTCVLADDRMSQIISLQVELEHLKGQGSNDQALFREVLHAWGRDAQINMAVEECAELVQALCHYRRQRCSAADVCNEIADVWILVLQLRAMFGEHLVMEKFRAKMHRLRLRLDERRVSVAGI